ncbi:IclR family transcriptional regulator [Pseudonocardia bannensis]|uniref:IclR family transcriptional regulator n=1 Tax=Pseudonocardia bannensis TaxID=630973 RepID=A0A848DIR2_9PSEU|nr:IclR family transcriptional regulator [Pseudonocardia bannensis]NMH92587.1 IclR family transcriptional regulator [Pseudonocardia bannensis]
MAADAAPRSLSGKVLDVLDAFSADAPELTLSDISRRTGLSLSTTHRIVRELSEWGALERQGRGPYRIGLRLFEVASLAPRGPQLREVALPYLEDLYEATHENVQLAVREGLELVFLERITGRDAVRVLTRVGGRFSLHATGVGLALLAFAPPEVQEQVLSGSLERWTERTITDQGQLRRMLADVRRTGVAISDRQVTMDALSVAAPVVGPDDCVVAALSLVVHADGASPHTLAPAVRTAARGISRALGSPTARRHPAGARRRASGP